MKIPRAYASSIPTRLQLDLFHPPPSVLTSILTLSPRPSPLVMATTEKIDLDSLAGSDPKKAEAIYKSILQGVIFRSPAFVGVAETTSRIEI